MSMAATSSREDAGPVVASDSHLPDTGVDIASNSSINFSQDVMNSIHSISQPVEMSDLSSSTPQIQASTAATLDDENISKATSVEQGIRFAADGEVTLTGRPTSNSRITPSSDSGIGPASDKPTTQSAPSFIGPQLVITLLMHSTETRHPYTIDEAYLRRRNVSVADNNPINMTVYTLKELILRDWRSEWESRPTSPTSIRLIHMGRMLDDKVYLKDSRFSNGDTPHIVHMTIKPQEAIDEEDARIAKGGARERDGSERSPGCRCLIM